MTAAAVTGIPPLLAGGCLLYACARPAVVRRLDLHELLWLAGSAFAWVESGLGLLSLRVAAR